MFKSRAACIVEHQKALPTPCPAPPRLAGEADPHQPTEDVGNEEEHALEVQLLQAAAAGDGAAVVTLLEQGAEPACETDEGVTPLMLAAEAGSAEAVQALLGELRAGMRRADASRVRLAGRLGCSQSTEGRAPA